MSERKIICKLRTGSKLYGTDRPDSDDDFVGVFLPSTQDMLGLQNCPTEWSQSVKTTDGDRNSKGDVDCKFYSPQRFFNLAAQGQPAQLEMLFTPKSQTLVATDEWQRVLENREFFISKHGIAPFIGFALAQAHKATLKGDNYNQIRDILGWGQILTAEQQNYPLGLHLQTSDDGSVTVIGGITEVKKFVNDHGFTMVEIAGRDYDVGVKTKLFLKNLETLFDRYGTRSKAAAEIGMDLKSYMHAYRLISEAKEYLEDGFISFPRPDAEFLKTIRSGEYKADFFEEITAKIDEVRKVQAASDLPEKANYSKIEQLCQQMIYQHLFTT